MPEEQFLITEERIKEIVQEKLEEFSNLDDRENLNVERVREIFREEFPAMLKKSTFRIEGTIQLLDGRNIVLGSVTGTKIGTATTQKLGFFNKTPIIQPTALTAQLTSITHTEPGTADYAIQNLTQTSPFGFVTQDEGNTVLKVILNLQTRVQELETKLETLGLIASN